MHRAKKNAAFLLTIVCLCSRVFGQDTLHKNKDYLNANLHYGFIMAHNKNMEYLINSHIPALDLNFIRPTDGQKQWERIYKNPEKGLGFYLCDLGDQQQLGYAMGAFAFVNFPLNPGRKFKLYVRAGDGIGLITKPYDRITNHKNNINGTYLNEFVYVRMNSVFPVAKALRMEAGIGLTHLSNGNWAQPNLGINLITANLGITMHNYKKTNYKYEPALDTVPAKFTRKPFLSLIGTAGLNELNARNGKKYGTYSLQLFAWKPVSPKSRWGTGFDLFYDFSNIARAEEGSKYYTSKRDLSNVQAGFRLGYEMTVGKFSIPIEMGSYFFTKSTANGPLYHRVGLRCYITQHLILVYTLKTHWATAENIEFGLGYRF